MTSNRPSHDPETPVPAPKSKTTKATTKPKGANKPTVRAAKPKPVAPKATTADPAKKRSSLAAAARVLAGGGGSMRTKELIGAMAAQGGR